MGRVTKFDPGRRSARPRRRRSPRAPRSTIRRWRGRIRLVVLAAALGWLWATNSGVIEPMGLMATEPERVDRHFIRCGSGRSFACVVDGDTFRLGDRRIRIIGIDAPETHPPRCAEEAALGEAATARLQALLNEGPFDMVASRADMTDRYGRDLRALYRNGRSIAEQLVAEGLARWYRGYKTSWC